MWQCIHENSVFHIATYGKTQQEAINALHDLMNGKLFHYAGYYEIREVTDQIELRNLQSDNRKNVAKLDTSCF